MLNSYIFRFLFVIPAEVNSQYNATDRKRFDVTAQITKK